ncbi:MarR family winged helix-turn-helix transcriptional regulator [Sphingomonas oligophenolica]|uniref:MarR family transcriptional regulator n=1 Tax=Sphingomonas oligophenolica TaxID=301154 RepID=A0ABU9YB81_9SPHN
MAMAESDGERVDIGVLDGLVGYHLRRAMGAFSVDYARAVAGTPMRQGLFGVMSVIAANPGISQGIVGKALGIQRANMVALITELGELGLVDREPSATDRRAFNLTLTDKGMTMLKDTLARIRDHEERMLAALSPAARQSLTATLRAIAAVEE